MSTSSIRRHRARITGRLVIAGLALVVGTAASAQVNVHDDFDDGMLDPAWQITFEHAEEWTSLEEGTDLVVTDIDPEFDSSGPWASVYLRQETEPIGDFALTYRLAWDSEGSVKAMQLCQVSLVDDCGNLVVVAGYSDPWVGHRGQVVSNINGEYTATGADSTPYAGNLEMVVTRTDGTILVEMDGTPLNTGTCYGDIVAVQMQFAFYGYSGGGGPSFFGTEWVDLVSLAGEPAAPPVIGDLDCDRIVDGADLGLLLGAWGTCGLPDDCQADLNVDGQVNGADLGLLLGNWGPPG